MQVQSWTVQLTALFCMCNIFSEEARTCLAGALFPFFFSYCLAGSSGRAGKPGEDVVVVAVGRLAYGSAAGSLKWYDWLASTGLARCRRRTGQTDRQETFQSGPALAQLVLDHVTASPRDQQPLALLSRLGLYCC